MKKWITERFKYGDDLVVVYQQVIYVDDINKCIYIATEFINFFGNFDEGKEEEFKPFPNGFPIKCGIIGYNLLPYKMEYCVCPFSPLPNPDFPKKGQESEDEEKEDDHEDPDPRHPRFSGLNDRIASFYGWPHHIPAPKTLAEAGFFFTKGTTDGVRCFSCGVGLKDFQPSVDPLKAHARYSPNCQYIRRIMGPNIEERLVSSSYYHVYQLQINKAKPHPRNPQFTTLQARIESYGNRNWPSNATQTPRALAEAGLYYAGVDDMVRCFCCDGGLRRWEPQDDPWAEHCRWFPKCPFAIAEKGIEYIARVLAAEREMEAYDMNGDFDDGTIQVENEIHHYLPMMQSIFQLSEQPNDEQDIDTLLQENKRLKRESLCSECQDNGRNALFLPCTHRVMCMSCASICKHCPRCRREIKNKIRTYLC